MGCVLVFPPDHLSTPNTTDTLENAFYSYELAIKPKVPVVIFELSSLNNVGRKVYGGNPNCPPLYHIPPSIYDDIEDIVLESAFCVSEIYLEYVIKNRCLNRSIFSTLETARQNIGLNVIGFLSETEDVQYEIQKA